MCVCVREKRARERAREKERVKERERARGECEKEVSRIERGRRESHERSGGQVTHACFPAFLSRSLEALASLQRSRPRFVVRVWG